MKRVLGLAGLSAVALAVRLLSGRESLWLDEMTAIEIAEKSIPHIWQSLQVTQHAPILDYLILHFVAALTDWDPAFWIPSLVWGVLSVPLTWLAARRWVGEPAAWWAAGLMVFAVLPVRYSLEARMYSLWLFALLGTLWALGRIADKPTLGRFLIWGAWSLGVLFTHSFGLVLVALEIAALALLAFRAKSENDSDPARFPSRTQRLAFLVLSVAILAILYAPQFLVLIARASTESNVGSPFRWSDLTPSFFWHDLLVQLGPRLGWVSFLMPLLALAGTAALLVQRRFGLAAAAWIWLLAPSLIILQTLYTESTFFAPRYFLFLCPVYLALAGAGIAWVVTAIPQRIPAHALLALLFACGACWSLERPREEKWFPLLQPLLESETAESVFIADGNRTPPYPRIETVFYFRHHPLRRHVGLLPNDPSTLTTWLSEHPETWVVELAGINFRPEIRDIFDTAFEVVHTVGGRRLLKLRTDYTAQSVSNEPPLLVPLDAAFGDNLRLRGYSMDPWTAKPGDWVTLSLDWECLTPPQEDWSISARSDRADRGDGKTGRIRFDYFPFGGVHRFPDWKPGERRIDPWPVRIPASQPDGPTTLSIKLEQQNALGSHHPHLPFYQTAAWTVADSTQPILIQIPGVEVSANGTSVELERGKISPKVVSGQEFSEGGRWLGVTVGREGDLTVSWEGTATAPPVRHFNITLADPATRAVIAKPVPATYWGRPPSTLRPGERAGYLLPWRMPHELRNRKCLFLLGTVDPRTGETVEQYSVELPASLKP